MPSVFEPTFPAQWAHLFHGHLQANVTDPEGIPASSIISLRDKWNLKVTWQVHGVLASSLGGKWQVRAYLESIGPGPEFVIASRDVDMTGATSYEETFPIEGLPATPEYPEEKDRAGAYKLVTVITSLNLQGQPAPFAGYEDGGILQFYAGPSLPERIP